MSRRLLLLAVIGILYTSASYGDLISAGNARANGDYASALAEYQRLAEAGDPVAQVNLGYMYYMGEGVTRDFGQAIAWYNEAASLGNADAQYNLAVAYAFGEGVTQNFTDAVKWYQAAADQGHAVAQYSLGLSYANGEGVPHDPSLATTWFTRSAEQGYLPAQLLLGIRYYTGDGVASDYEAAAKWYRLAADQGDVIAQFNLAGLYRNGQGVTQDSDEARTWYTKSAEQGYPAAAVELAAMNEAEKPAAEETVAEAVTEPATTDPAILVTTTETPVVAEVETGISAVATVPEQPAVPAADESLPVESPAEPEPAAMVTAEPEQTATPAVAENLPPITVESEAGPVPVQVDGPESIQQQERPPASTAELIQRQLAGINAPVTATTQAANNSMAIDAPASVVVAATDQADETSVSGLMSIDNIDPSLPDDSASGAIELLTEGTPVTTTESVMPEQPVVVPDEAGIPEISSAEPVASTMADTAPATDKLSQDAQAALYEDAMNELNNKNFGVAHNLLRSAADNGHPLAQYQLALLYHQGLGTQQDNEQAAEWYRQAAEQGVTDAQFSLGNMYLLGEGMIQDDVQARFWYERAAGQGHTGAMHNLQNLARLNPVPLEQTDMAAAEVPAADNVLLEPQADLIELPADEPVQQAVITAETVPVSSATAPVESTTTEPASSSPVLDYERGLAYASGSDLPKDLKSAFTYFKRAAEANHVPAQFKLGVAYAYGEGTTIDHVQSAYWYEKAAMQGHPLAQRNLGLLYESGDDKVKNRPLALAWFDILAERGNEMDILHKESLRNELTAPELSRAEQLKQELLATMANRTNATVPGNDQ